MRKGDRVVCTRDAPATVLWSYFDGREGQVTELNMGEIGVQFSGDPVVYWFKPTELRYASNRGKKD